MNTDTPPQSRGRIALWLALWVLVFGSYCGTSWALPPNAGAKLSLGDLVILLIMTLPIFLVGGVAAVAVSGPRGAQAGLRYLLGRARKSEYALASRALGAAASFVLHAGICLGFFGLVFWLDRLGQGGNGPFSTEDWPAQMAFMNRARTAITFAPLLGICGGRFLLGVPAESAALQARIQPPRFSATPQVCSLAIFTIWSFLIFTSYQTIAG